MANSRILVILLICNIRWSTEFKFHAPKTQTDKLVATYSHKENHNKKGPDLFGLVKTARVKRKASPGQYDALYNSFVTNLSNNTYNSYNAPKTSVVHGFYGDHVVRHHYQYDFNGTSTNNTEYNRYTVLNETGLNLNNAGLNLNNAGLNLNNSGLNLNNRGLNSNSTGLKPRRRHRNRTRILQTCIICKTVGCPQNYKPMGSYCIPEDEQYDDYEDYS